MINKKVILTGATGFIGSHVVKELLKNNYTVAILCRNNSSLSLLKDFEDKIRVYKTHLDVEEIIASLKEFQPDYVIHLASLFIASHEKNQVMDLLNSNITYGSLVLEAMKECGISNLINTGTSWQHYNNEVYNPVCLYAATKEAFEKIIDYYVLALGFKCLTLTIFDSYGPYDNRGKLVSLLKEFSIKETLLQLSPGEQKIDLTHVDDISKAYVKALEHLEGINPGTHINYGVCTGRSLSLKEVIRIFQEETGYRVNVKWGAKPYRFREVMEPWSSYKVLPNWQSTVSFEEGVKDFVK